MTTVSRTILAGIDWRGHTERRKNGRPHIPHASWVAAAALRSSPARAHSSQNGTPVTAASLNTAACAIGIIGAGIAGGAESTVGPGAGGLGGGATALSVRGSGRSLNTRKIPLS